MSLWMNAGTIAVTLNNKKVTGTGTAFANSAIPARPGQPIVISNVIYEIESVESDTVLWLATNYLGASATGVKYSIMATMEGSFNDLARRAAQVMGAYQGYMDVYEALFTGSGNVTVTLPDGSVIVLPCWGDLASKTQLQSAISDHVSKVGAHPISGVSGLDAALAGKYSPSNKPTAQDVGAYPIRHWPTGGVLKEWVLLISANRFVGVNAQDISVEISGGNTYGRNTSPVCLLKVNLRNWDTVTDPSVGDFVTLTSINGEAPEYRIVCKIRSDTLDVFMERPAFSNMMTIQIRNMYDGTFLGAWGYDPNGFVVPPKIVAFR